MKLVFPWPPRVLHPNARPNRYEKARAVKAYRTQCGWIARSAHAKAPDGAEIRLNVTFRPPSNRGDGDNMLSACKSLLDGLADAMGVNDRKFAITPVRGEPVTGGRVEIEICAPTELS